jgi:2-iminobutanoate/2-iminopropanoate deaminase
VKPTPRAIQTERAPRPVGPYSQAVAFGDWVFVSGQIPLDPQTSSVIEGDIEAQTERVLANLRAILEAAGASLAQVVKTTVFLADLADFPRMNAVYAQHFSASPAPARSTIEAGRLPLGVKIEIDAIAHRG